MDMITVLTRSRFTFDKLKLLKRQKKTDHVSFGAHSLSSIAGLLTGVKNRQDISNEVSMAMRT